MTLQIDMSFTLQATPEQRLAELRADQTWLLKQFRQDEMTQHDFYCQLATIEHECRAIIKKQAAQVRELDDLSRAEPAGLGRLERITKRPVVNIP